MNIQIVKIDKEVASFAFSESDIFLFEVERNLEAGISHFEVRDKKNNVLVELDHKLSDGSLRLLANAMNDLADVRYSLIGNRLPNNKG